MIEKKEDLDRWYQTKDPWGYETNADDLKRRELVLSEIRLYSPSSVLDIGCGNGFITNQIEAPKVIGVDYSSNAIAQAKESKASGADFKVGDIFDIDVVVDDGTFDLVVITGVLYPQYIGNAKSLIYQKIDKVLKPGGHLLSVHIDEWYSCRFPYLMTKQISYSYREYQHCLEVYVK